MVWKTYVLHTGVVGMAYFAILDIFVAFVPICIMFSHIMEMAIK